MWQSRTLFSYHIQPLQVGGMVIGDALYHLSKVKICTDLLIGTHGMEWPRVQLRPASDDWQCYEQSPAVRFANS